MSQITKEAVFSMHADEGTHRKQFSHSSGIQKNKRNPTFSVPFDNGLCQHFRDGTGKYLTFNERFNQHYCFLSNAQEIDLAETWEKAQGTRVFIRNCLDTSLALDVNFVDNSSGVKTEIGDNEEAAKYHQNGIAINNLVLWSETAIKSISYLSAADYTCAIPAMPEKGFDLPTCLANNISKSVGKTDVTQFFTIYNKRISLKNCSLEDKWGVWEAANINYCGLDLKGKRIILIDDKYQSGITQQYFGMVLKSLGCIEVHGLSMVKTLRDTDNVQVIDV